MPERLGQIFGLYPGAERPRRRPVRQGSRLFPDFRRVNSLPPEFRPGGPDAFRVDDPPNRLPRGIQGFIFEDGHLFSKFASREGARRERVVFIFALAPCALRY